MSNQAWAADKVERKQLIDLIPYDRNPKIHPDSQVEQLANSIREWGWTIPILIDESGQVIAGHGRLYAAQKLGLSEVPCMIAEGWSEEKKKAYVIADNKLAEKGSWDNALLYSELKKINESEFDLSLTGMDEEFNFMDYSPNLEPSYDYRDVNHEALENAEKNIAGAIDSIQADKSNEGIEVMCPYCAETFKFSGV